MTHAASGAFSAHPLKAFLEVGATVAQRFTLKHIARQVFIDVPHAVICVHHVQVIARAGIQRTSYLAGIAAEHCRH